MSARQRWDVLNVRLDQPLRPICRPSDSIGLYIVFWWYEIPLGDAMVSARDLPINEAAVQRLAARAIAPAVGNYSFPSGGFKAPLPMHHTIRVPPKLETLASLRHPLANVPIMPRPSRRDVSVSVIICTRRRPKQLRRCLSALSESEEGALETIVVDNSSGDGETRTVVEEFPGVIHCVEPCGGLSQARNTGIKQSSGDIIAFTDDDVLVSRNWIGSVREALSNERVFGLTGLVLAGELETQSQLRFEVDYGFNCGYRPKLFDSVFFTSMVKRGVPVWLIGAGANMAFRRVVFRKVGLFDTRLGAGASGCSEDSEMWYRMLAAGMPIVYDPRAVVFHFHRQGDKALRKQIVQYMRGHVVALLVQFERHGHRGNIRRLYTSLPRVYLKRVLRLPRRHDWQLLLSELLACAWGVLTYFGYFARRPNSRTNAGSFEAGAVSS
jgi:GT2 family glycosyltransferase